MTLEEIEQRLARAERDNDVESIRALAPEISAMGRALAVSGSHNEAIALLRKSGSILPDAPELKATLALALGGKGEKALRLADRLGVLPAPGRLPYLEALFQEATETDPALPDPFWDLAVVNARFRADFAEAQRFLTAARGLGYAHPMMAQLESMIQQGLSGPRIEQSRADSGEKELLQLVWALVTWPDLPPDGPLADVERQFPPTHDAVFESYCRKAAQLVKEGKLDVLAFERARQTAKVALGGDAAEYGADLMRCVARELGDPAVLGQATNDHLRVLAEMSFALRGRINEGAQWMRRARRTAARGLKIVEAAPEKIDPDVHAELLLAYGQTFTHPSQYQLAEGTRHFLRALDLKESAGIAADVVRLKELLRELIAHEIMQVSAAALGLGQLGASLADLEAGYEAAKRLGDDAFAADAGLALARGYSTVRQPRNAETILREVLSLPGIGDKRGIQAQFQLAAALSESHRAEAALELQNALLAEPDKLFQAIDPVIFWLNLGNSRRETGKLEAAREAFTKSLSATRPARENEIDELKAQATALLGEVEFLRNRPEQGTALLEEAEKMFSIMLSTAALHFHALAARVFFKANRTAETRHHLERARYLLSWHLHRGGSLSVWESMLQEWTYLDAYDVETALQGGTEKSRTDALVSAEGAKGRLLAWLRNFHAPEAAKAALDEQRQRAALEKTQSWAAASAGRAVVSLFAAKGGLAVFGIGAAGTLTGSWLDDFGYDQFEANYFMPWETAIQQAAVAQSESQRQPANTYTEFLLDRIGSWLWRAFPQLANGGEELVLVPHRLFRSLPLAHCRLPTGLSLSELFERVIISPSVFEFAQALEHPRYPAATPAVTALVDPDGTLPFAQLEGFYAAGKREAKVRDEVTALALRQAVASPGIALISAHGQFRQDNPWNSMIVASDMPLEVAQLLDSPLLGSAPGLVVLGVCEAGKTRRSASDEPLGFPSLLVQGGVPAVIAPMWWVDDFASLVFMTHLFDCVREEMSPARAVTVTTRWMRHLSAEETLAHLDRVLRTLDGLNSPSATEALEHCRPRLRITQTWLESLPRGRAPFGSPLDWAAFQVIGAPL